ncbi:MAG: hypothetical protein WD177_00215, partial [Methylophaga sp.]
LAREPVARAFDDHEIARHTSTRNFPNRLGNGADVYLSSAELAAVVASLGRIPTVAEYMEKVAGIQPMADEIYRYLNFHELEEYKQAAVS